MSRPRMTKRVARGLRVMRSLAQVTVDNGTESELPEDELEGLALAIVWLDGFLGRRGLGPVREG